MLQKTRPTANASSVRTGVFDIAGGAEPRLKTRLGAAALPNMEFMLNDFAGFDVKQERFKIVVPATYNDDVPHGLFVWNDPGDGVGLAGGWGEVLTQKKIIYIGAYRAGNNHDSSRRVRLALEARKYALLNYNIDPRRMYVGGFSGGGRISARLLDLYPAAFAGSIHVCGSFHQWGAVGPYTAASGAKLKGKNRMVLISGSGDFNYPTEKQMFGEIGGRIETLFIDVPGLGHAVPGGAKWITEALDYLDAPRRGATDAKGAQRTASLTESVVTQAELQVRRNPDQARQMVQKLWADHPDLRKDPRVQAMVEELEKLPPASP